MKLEKERQRGRGSQRQRNGKKTEGVASQARRDFDLRGRRGSGERKDGIGIRRDGERRGGDTQGRGTEERKGKRGSRFSGENARGEEQEGEGMRTQKPKEEGNPEQLENIFPKGFKRLRETATVLITRGRRGQRARGKRGPDDFVRIDENDKLIL